MGRWCDHATVATIKVSDRTVQCLSCHFPGSKKKEEDTNNNNNSNNKKKSFNFKVPFAPSLSPLSCCTYAESFVNLVCGVVGADQMHASLDTIDLLGIRHDLESCSRARTTGAPGDVDELGSEVAHSLDAVVQVDHTLQ